MKRIELGTEWLTNWQPTQTTEVTDRGCKGLIVRGGPSGVKTFYRWADELDAAAGKRRRRRMKLGHFPSMTLAAARKAVHEARESRRAVASGNATVAELAEAYRRDILSQRKAPEPVWAIIQNHILETRPDPSRPPFGQWLAREVQRRDVAEVARLAKVERDRDVTDRNGRQFIAQVGGLHVARSVLFEMKAIFQTAVDAGSLETSPASTVRRKALGIPEPTERNRKLEKNEIPAFLAALDLNRLLDGGEADKGATTARLALAFLLYVPVRTHSLRLATWDEFDLDGHKWTIPVAHLKLRPKDRAKASAFEVPLPDTAVAILRRLRELSPDSPWVLASPLAPSKPLGRVAIVHALAALQEKGKLSFGSRLTVHDLRRTWRSLASEAEVSFEVAERSLAHKLPGIAETYARADLFEQRARAADLVGATLDRIRLGKAATVVPMHERARA